MHWPLRRLKTKKLYWHLRDIDHVPELASLLLEIRELNQRAKYLLYDPLSLVAIVREYLYRVQFQDTVCHLVHDSHSE